MSQVINRCRGNECRKGACCIDYAQRAWTLPENALMGVDELYPPSPLSSKLMDKARCARYGSMTFTSLPFPPLPPFFPTLGAALFISSAAKALPATDVWCILYPSLRHFMRSDIRNVEAPNILKALKSPVSNDCTKPLAFRLRHAAPQSFHGIYMISPWIGL